MLNIFDKLQNLFDRFVNYKLFTIVSGRSVIMSLGKNILTLRKKNGLSQEQLGEKVNVTRQTISNWELDETAPNPEQLKLLSKALQVSIDTLVDNDIVANKMDKTIYNIAKFIGIIFLILLVIDIITFIIFMF
jgi:transcriptional regulator with XRE-family HTH domain